MAFGAANLVRQVAIIVTTADIPQATRVVSWVTTALVVIVAINSVAVMLQRRGDAAQLGRARTLAPTWPLRRGVGGRQPDRSRDNPTKDEMSQHQQEQATTSTKWAPWWVYLVIIVGANSLRRAVVADEGAPATRVVVALTVSVALFITITVIHRANTRVR